jgi:hypothetical protein
MIYIPSFIQTGSHIEKFMRGEGGGFTRHRRKEDLLRNADRTSHNRQLSSLLSSAFYRSQNRDIVPKSNLKNYVT